MASKNTEPYLDLRKLEGQKVFLHGNGRELFRLHNLLFFLVLCFYFVFGAATISAAIDAPTITAQPVSEGVKAGQAASFSVAAIGAGLTYQWLKNGITISGATSSTYTTPPVAASDDRALFTVIVSNSGGSVTSNAATLNVATLNVNVPSAPTITAQPVSEGVKAGQAASFSVAAIGAGLTYQWLKNGITISGATSSTYTTPPVAASDDRALFTVIVSNSGGSVTSNAATLNVATLNVNVPSAPTITAQPVSEGVKAGQAASFSVAAIGAGLTYQWLKNGITISGATSSTYTTPPVAASDDRALFTVIVSNSGGSVTSNAATLNVATLNVNVPSAPTITAQPVSEGVKAGQAASFSVAAIGAGLTYQWLKNGITISGATSSTYTTPPVAASDDRALFTVIVSNSGGSVTSNAGTLTVNSDTGGSSAAVTVSPNDATVQVGSTLQLAATVTGTTNTAVTWSLSSADCVGAACGTISTGGLYTPPASLSSSATLNVTATSMEDPTKSASARVTVVAAVAVFLTLSPASASVPTSGIYAFAATVTGTSNTAVTWSLAGAGCSGPSCGTLSTSSLSAVYMAPFAAPSPARVSVIVTSAADSSKTASASVTIVSGVGVAVTPTSVSVTTGATQQLSASVVGTSNTSVTWTLQGDGCSATACGTLDGRGLYTAPASVPTPASVTVTAISSEDPSKSASASIFIVPLTSDNATEGINIPQSHPRLFWNTSRLTQAQHWWAGNRYTPNYDNPNPFDPYDTLFACMMTNNSSWCNAQINWAVNLNETSCYQSVGCDSMRMFGEPVMLTYDWLYSRMTAAQRATIISNWNNWQTHLDTNNAWGNTAMPSSNYFAGAFRTDFALGVATQGDNVKADDFLDYALNRRWSAVTNFASASGTGPMGAKGYGMPAQEGSQYGRYSLGYYVVPQATSALMGRDLWGESTALKAGVLQTIYNTLPMRTVSRGIYDGWTWSDDENWPAGATLYGGGGMQSRYYGDFMMAAAQALRDTPIGKVARQWINTVNPNIAPMWKAVDSGGNSQALSTLPLDYYASGPQFAYWRNNWNADASALFLQMGQTFGVGHNHFDVGNFQWFRGGSYLVRETPTYETTVAGYNLVGVVNGSSGYAHNVPLIGGLPGVTAGCTDTEAIVRRMESQSSYSYGDADISGTYTNSICAGNHPERENAYAKHVEREFVFFRDIEVLLILDRLQADTSSRNRTFVSHCENKPSLIDASHYVCTNGTQQAQYSVLLPANPSLVVVDEGANGATCGKGVCQQRLEINDNSPIGAASYFLVAIQGMNTGGDSLIPSVRDNGSSWTVILDANHSADLNKGLTSSAGSVTINGQTTNLRSNVQPMTITDNGPLW